ncbi:hypothetical protein ABIA40_000325 [Bradyrhizobium sp. USDA 223]
MVFDMFEKSRPSLVSSDSNGERVTPDFGASA